MARVALSFDDGPGPATEALLDVLAARGARATFFLLGKNVERARATAVRVAREGHVVGNHTFSHARPDAIGARPFVDEILRVDALLADVAREAGVTLARPIPVRLPYGPVEVGGKRDPRLEALASLGRTHVHWTGDFDDWTDPPPEPEALAVAMRAHADAQAALGLAAVLDLHDSSKLFVDRRATVAAVRLFLDGPSDRDEIFTIPT